jgi:hypothetical protein
MRGVFLGVQRSENKQTKPIFYKNKTSRGEEFTKEECITHHGAVSMVYLMLRNLLHVDVVFIVILMAQLRTLVPL